jgi:protein-tyrosine phosphatase
MYPVRPPALGIDFVVIETGGRIGMTACPGRIEPEPRPARVLSDDLDAIVATGARMLVSLIEHHEFALLQVGALGADAIARGLVWQHLPIPDFGIPGGAFEEAWTRTGADIHALLDAGEALVIHCRGGLGRSGTVAARLLVERGFDPQSAIAAVRAARPGAIETVRQMSYVASFTSGSRT